MTNKKESKIDETERIEELKAAERLDEVCIKGKIAFEKDMAGRSWTGHDLPDGDGASQGWIEIHDEPPQQRRAITPHERLRCSLGEHDWTEWKPDKIFDVKLFGIPKGQRYIYLRKCIRCGEPDTKSISVGVD